MERQKEALFSNQALKEMIIPLFLEQLLVMLVGMADTLIVSYVGEAAVSGVSLVNQFNTIFIYLFTALASSGAVVISQYFGRREREKSGEAASQLLLFSTLFSVLIAGILLASNWWLLHLIEKTQKQSSDEIHIHGVLPCPIRLQILEKLDAWIAGQDQKVIYDLQAASMGLEKQLDLLITESADIVVITKGDNVSQAEREVFAARVSMVNPKALVLPVNGLSGQGSFELGTLLTRQLQNW